VNMPPMSELHIPIENDDYVPLEDLMIGGNPSTAIDVAIQEPGEVRPLTAWVVYPGPKTPTTRGEYFVFIRATAAPKTAICVGKLIMF